MPIWPSILTLLRRLMPVSAVLVTAGVLGEEPASRPATRPAPPATRSVAVDPATRAAIAGLLKDLSNDDWRVRDRAAGKLAEFGELSIDDVKRFALTTTDDEARRRATTILSKIELLQRNGPTRVTLALSGVSAEEAFAELSKQGHMLIRPFRASLWHDRDFPPVTVNQADIPFWQAVRDLCIQVGLKPMAGGVDRGEDAMLVLLPDVNKDMAAAHAQAGSFMVGLARLAGSPADGKPPTADAELMLSVYADPRWRVINYPAQITIQTVLDADGKALEKPEPLIMQGFKEGSPIWTMRTTLHGLSPTAKRLGQIRGAFKARVLEQSDVVEIPDVIHARNAVKRLAGGHSLHLAEISSTNLECTLKVVITRGSLSAQDWRTEMEGQGIRLVDRKGVILPRTDTQIQENGPQVTYDLRFSTNGNPAAPARLIWRLPLESREMSVSFELQDLPITGL